MPDATLSAATYDPVDDRLYVLTRDSLVVIDGQSGATLAAAPLSASRSWVGLAVARP